MVNFVVNAMLSVVLCVGAADIHGEQHESMTVGTGVLWVNHMQSKSHLTRV